MRLIAVAVWASEADRSVVDEALKLQQVSMTPVANVRSTVQHDAGPVHANLRQRLKG
jgi:hypothetical protein